jgi:putative DNA primase/helicase
LSLLYRLTLRPLSSVAVTSATVYRAIQKWHPTFLIDEIDTLKDNSGKIDPQLVGILNAGFDGDAKVPRCNDNNDVEMFDVKCPKALAAIGKLPETWADRSIVVNLRRKLKEEKVAPLRKTPREEYQTLRRKMMRWALDNAQLVKTYVDDDSILPSGMNDRADDAWLALLAIAKAAGGDWLGKAQAAARDLSGDAAEDDDDSVKTVLLLKLRTLFKERIMANRVGMTFEELSQTEDALNHHIETEDILKFVNADKEAPWASWHKGEGLTAEKLKVLLKDYPVKPDKPPTRAQREKLGRGYTFRSLRDVFERYLCKEKPTTEEDENQPF